MTINEIADIDADGTARLKEECWSLVYDSPQEVAELLAGHDGPVEVRDIDEMPEEFAEIIVRHNGKGLQFNHNNANGPRLTNRVAEILSTYNGPLTINDISVLNYGNKGDEVEIAKAFAKHNGTLTLGITKLSIEAAKELIKHQGPVQLDSLIEYGVEYGDLPEDQYKLLLPLLDEAYKRWWGQSLL
jgi:hypothetical protein